MKYRIGLLLLRVGCFRFTSSVVPPHPHPLPPHPLSPCSLSTEPNLHSNSSSSATGKKVAKKSHARKKRGKERTKLTTKNQHRIVGNKTQAKKSAPKSPAASGSTFQQNHNEPTSSSGFSLVRHSKGSHSKNETLLGRHEARSACRTDPVLSELAEDFRADDDGHLGQVSLAQHLEVALMNVASGFGSRTRRGVGRKLDDTAQMEVATSKV